MMSTPQHRKKASARSIGIDVASRIGYVVGVDAENNAHVHYAESQTVKVHDVGPDYEIGDYLSDEDVIHVEELEGRPLSHWMAFVADFRGWEEVTDRAPDFRGGE